MAAALLLSSVVGTIVGSARLAAAADQWPRYDLGQRVKRFELAFERVLADEPSRRLALPHLNSAVTTFFGLNLPEAARNIDSAYLSLLPADRAAAESRFLRFSCEPSRRLFDPTHPGEEVTIVFRARYEQVAPVGEEGAPATSVDPVTQVGSAQTVLVSQEVKAKPKSIAYRSQRPKLQITIRYSARTQRMAHLLTSEVPDAMGDEFRLTLPRMILDRLEPDDYWFTAQVEDPRARQSFSFPGWQLSVVPRVSQRLDAVESRLDKIVEPTSRESARDRVRWIRSLAAGETLETDFPAEDLLNRCELAIRSAASKSGVFSQMSQPDWVTVSNGQWSCPTRIFPAVGRDPRPLVIAMHGIGGSENMFPETLGAGKIVTLCQQRNWSLVTPRMAPGEPRVELSALLDQLEPIIRLDRSRVFLVGHSMGAYQALSLTMHQPDQVRGYAAIAGGRAIDRPERIKGIPGLFVTGDQDFARGGVQAAFASLPAEESAAAYREFSAVEHFAVVQVALGEVFAMFDDLAPPNLTSAAR